MSEVRESGITPYGMYAAYVWYGCRIVCIVVLHTRYVPVFNN